MTTVLMFARARELAGTKVAEVDGVRLPVVGHREQHLDLVHALHDVVVGQDIAIRRNDKTRTQRLSFALTPAAAAWCLRHAALEKVPQTGRQPFQIWHLPHA